MMPYGVVAPVERLGRGVFSERKAGRARRGRVVHSLFLERNGEARISTDRLDTAAPSEAINIAEQTGHSRGSPFYGWAVVLAEAAAQNGRRVEATPRSNNPHHADIVLPDPVIKDREEQKRHAQELADASEWCEPDYHPK